MSQADRSGSVGRTQQAGGAGAHHLPFLQPGCGRTVRLDYRIYLRILTEHEEALKCIRRECAGCPAVSSAFPAAPYHPGPLSCLSPPPTPPRHYLCNSYSNAKVIIHGRTVPFHKGLPQCAIPSSFIIQIKEVLHAFFFLVTTCRHPPSPFGLSLFQERLWPLCPFHSSEGGSGGSSLCVSRVSVFATFSTTH